MSSISVILIGTIDIFFSSSPAPPKKKRANSAIRPHYADPKVKFGYIIDEKSLPFSAIMIDCGSRVYRRDRESVY